MWTHSGRDNIDAISQTTLSNAFSRSKKKHGSNERLPVFIYFVQHCLTMRLTRWSIHVNTFRPRQHRRHFADDTFKRIFLNENIRISMKISLKFVPNGPINNILASVPIMECLGADQATSHYLNQWWLDHWRIYSPLQSVRVPRGQRHIYGLYIYQWSVAIL